MPDADPRSFRGSAFAFRPRDTGPSMTPWRHQPPAVSPLSVRALVAAAGIGDSREAARADIAARWRVRHVTLTDSGTSALTLALRLAVTRRPGYCLLPGFGCFDLASAAMGAGVPVVLYDIDPRTLAPDLGSLAPLLTEACSALVVVDQFGIPPALDEVTVLARRVGAVVIEDAAQAAGATWAGKPLGQRADATVLSFGRGKGLTAGNGGALLLADDTVLADTAALAGDLPDPPESRVAAVVTLAAQHALSRPALFALPANLPFLRLGETIYKPPRQPNRMSRLAGRVLRTTLGLLDDEIACRRGNAAAFRRTVSAIAPDTAVHIDPRSDPCWLRLPVILRRPLDDSGTARRLGIVPSYPHPLSELAPLVPHLAVRTELPGARTLCERLVTIPVHRAVTARDARAIEAWLTANLPPDAPPAS